MRRCLLNPIPELELAAKLLDATAEALLQSRVDLAGKLFVAADFPEIMGYARELVGPLSSAVHRMVKRPKCLPKAARDPTRMPTPNEQLSIFERDGWRCRFCGTKVICKAARAVLVRLFPFESRWTSAEYLRHSALYAMASSLDHVIPHGRGGKNEVENFVTACYCCQFGRGEWLLDEVEVQDPRARPPVVDSWDGLSRIASV